MNLPWTVTCYTNSLGASVKDSLGNIVALFNDAALAYKMIEIVNLYYKTPQDKK